MRELTVDKPNDRLGNKRTSVDSSFLSRLKDIYRWKFDTWDERWLVGAAMKSHSPSRIKGTLNVRRIKGFSLNVPRVAISTLPNEESPRRTFDRVLGLASSIRENVS